MNNDNILVIGGAGYIGSHIVADLCKSSYKVIVYDNLSTGFESNIHKNAIFVKGDILDDKSLERVFSKGVDSVFHFAALKAAGNSMIHPESFSDVNISGSIKILHKVTKFNVKNFIFSSSAAVYGYPEYLPIDEMHKTEPINYYGFTKLVIEGIIKWYAKIHKFNYASLRYFNAAGYDVLGRIVNKEKNTTNLLPLVMEVAAGLRDYLEIYGNDYNTKDGTCIRDYIHVNDLSDAHIKSLSYIRNNNKNMIINLATGNGYSVDEVVNVTEKLTNKNIQYKYSDRRLGDPAELVAKTTSAYNLLGWKPKYSDIETIIKSMWEIYNN